MDNINDNAEQMDMKKGDVQPVQSIYLLCSYCEKNETDITCDSCGEPVCEDCCVQMTIHNQIDYPLCLHCGDVRNDMRYEEGVREEERQEAVDKVEKEKSEKRKRAYWTPEAVEKRRLRKIERRREKIEAHNEQVRRTAKILNDMFRGMF